MNMVDHRLLLICIDYQLLVNCIRFEHTRVNSSMRSCHPSLAVVFIILLAVSSVSPNNGSTHGGTSLTINGEYFSNSSRHPLVVNVDEQPCTVLSTNSTTIQCQILLKTAANRSNYHGRVMPEYKNKLFG